MQLSFFMGQIRHILLFCRKNKIVIHKLLEKNHNALCHPGETCAELSTPQHFYWKKLRKKRVRNSMDNYHLRKPKANLERSNRKIPIHVEKLR